MDSLPLEIVNEILLYLNIVDIINFKLVCKIYNNLLTPEMNEYLKSYNTIYSKIGGVINILNDMNHYGIKSVIKKYHVCEDFGIKHIPTFEKMIKICNENMKGYDINYTQDDECKNMYIVNIKRNKDYNQYDNIIIGAPRINIANQIPYCDIIISSLMTILILMICIIFLYSVAPDMWNYILFHKE